MADLQRCILIAAYILLLLTWTSLPLERVQASHGDWFYRSDDGFCIIGTHVASYADPEGYTGSIVLSLMYASKTLANPTCYILPSYDKPVVLIYASEDTAMPDQSANLISGHLSNIQASATSFTQGCTEESGYMLDTRANDLLQDALHQNNVIQITSHLYKAGTVRGVVSVDGFREQSQRFQTCVDGLQ